jgi:hypothetical protein
LSEQQIDYVSFQELPLEISIFLFLALGEGKITKFKTNHWSTGPEVGCVPTYIILLDMLSHYFVNPSIGTMGTVSVPLKSLFLEPERGKYHPLHHQALGSCPSKCMRRRRIQYPWMY